MRLAGIAICRGIVAAGLVRRVLLDTAERDVHDGAVAACAVTAWTATCAPRSGSCRASWLVARVADREP